MHRRRTTIIAAVTGLVTAGLLLPAGPAHAAAPYRLAVTFDGSLSASWLHVEGAGSAPTSALSTLGTGTVTRTTWTTASIPSYVASVPGVVAGDQKVGVFPAYATTGTNFAAVKVTPTAFGVGNDVLAPGTKDLQFGADIKFNSPMPGTRPEDDGNNVIQRGRSANDQYKVQVDKQSNGTYKASCVLRDQGAVISDVVNDTSLVPSNWYRLLCTRTTVDGKDFVTLSVENLTAGTAPLLQSEDGLALTNLNYASATATSPFPVAIGAKVKDAGAIDPKSDQFNGRIDNAYLAIDWP